MKRILVITLAFMALSCSPRVERLQTGDLIFVGIPADYRIDGSMSDAIADATCPDSLNIIHTAIADVDEDGIWIIDATIKHGVDRHPLDTFLCDFTLNDGSYPTFIVMRLNDDSGAEAHVARAREFLGRSYNCSFTPCDTALYCTELVHDSYLNPDGSFIFGEAPMNFLAPDGTMPVYWEQLFELIGQTVPQGKPGTNPRAMMNESCIHEINVQIP